MSKRLESRAERRRAARVGSEMGGETVAGGISRRSLAGVLTATAALAVCIVVLTFRPVSDPDTWFHLELGKWIAANHAVPHTDPFSYTAGSTPYVPSGWLTAWLMFKLDGIYPESSKWLIIMVTAAVTLVCAVVVRRAMKYNHTTIPVTLLLMAGLSAAVSRWSPRPDVWSPVGLVAVLYLLSGTWLGNTRSSRMVLWALVPIIVLWANLHAGVLVALPFLLSYLCWAMWRWYQTREQRWLLCAAPVAVASVAWVANPYGAGLVGLAWRIAEIPRVEWVMEWMPFFKRGFPMAWPVYVMAGIIVAATGWCFAKFRSRFHPLEVVWIALLIGLALWQRRQISLLAFGVPLLLAPHLGAAAWWLQRTAWRAVAAPVAMAAVVVPLQISGANGNGGGLPQYGRLCAALPCITGDFLAANPPPGPIFNSYNMGGYLLHVLYPTTKVYIDGRLDAYPHGVWLDMLALEENRLPIDALMAKYGIQTFVVPSADSFGDPVHLASRLAARKDFALVHVDDVAAVFTRRTPETVAWISAYEFKAATPWNLARVETGLRNPESRHEIFGEVGRLMQQSGKSATSLALAGFVANAISDKVTAAELLAAAQQTQPQNRLLLQVQNKIR